MILTLKPRSDLQLQLEIMPTTALAWLEKATGGSVQYTPDGPNGPELVVIDPTGNPEAIRRGLQGPNAAELAEDFWS